MRPLRLVVPLVAIGMILPIAAASAQEKDRGITILRTKIAAKDSISAKVRWDARDLRKQGRVALSLALVATTGSQGRPLLTRSLSANSKQPQKTYSISLTRHQQRLVRAADGIGFAATQKSGSSNGLYSRAWVAHAGALPGINPNQRLMRTVSRCSPVTAGGSYSACYYGYTDLSSVVLDSANFTDAQFPYTTLSGTSFKGANLSYAQMGYAMMQGANLTNANLTGAYLYGVNMTGAVVTGAIFTNAQFCNTIMPDGSTTNNANC